MTTATSRPKSAKLEGIQLLRAVAALLVVAGHAIGAVEHRAELFGAIGHPRYAGGVGVDIFFLISGFIMVFASRRMFGSAAGSRDFLLRRLVRIVPLYWAVTGIALLLLLLKGASPPIAATAASFAFVPFDTTGRGDGFAFPIVDLGWTLNYEMMFYVVFALFIPLGQVRAVLGVAGAMVAITVAGAILQPGTLPIRFWAQPIILEFAAGAAIALAHGSGRIALGTPVRCGLLAVAVGWYLLDPCGLMGREITPNSIARVAGWGLPSALILIAVVGGDLPMSSRAARLGVLLGDSSYALYLLHPFVLVVALRAVAFRPLDLPGGSVLFMVLALAAACAAALLAHLWVERPVTTWLTRRLQHAGAPITAVPLPPDATIGAPRG